MDQTQVYLPEDQSSRQKTKQFFLLLLIIFFTVIIFAIISVFAVLKHHAEARSLSANPIQAIMSVCHSTTRYYSSCVHSISSLHNHNHAIHASDIFRLSVAAAFLEFYAIRTLPRELGSKPENKNITAVLTNCQNLFTDSLNQLNRSLIMVENPNEEKVKDCRNMIARATSNVDRCLNGLATAGQILIFKKVKVRIHKAETYLLNSLGILDSMDSLYKMFDPSVQSMLASFMLKRENYELAVASFCLPYLVLIFLFCSLMRVFK